MEKIFLYLAAGLFLSWLLHKAGILREPKWPSSPFRITAYSCTPDCVPRFRALNTHVFTQWEGFVAFAAPHELEPEALERHRTFWTEELMACPPGHVVVFVVTRRGVEAVAPDSFKEE